MRYFTTSLAIAAIALSLGACTGKSSSSDQSSTTSTEATAAATTATDMGSQASPEASAAAPGAIPDYPGATVQSQTNAGSVAQTNVAGRVLETPDSFDKVYGWYQQKMPAGSERLHLTQPSPSALFVIMNPADKSQDSVTIAVSHGKTMVTIAHVVSRTAQ